MTLRDEIRAAMAWAAPYQVERIAEFIEARETTLWEAAAKIADEQARLYAETDLGKVWPKDDTIGAVACGVNIAATCRDRAARRAADDH